MKNFTHGSAAFALATLTLLGISGAARADDFLDLISVGVRLFRRVQRNAWRYQREWEHHDDDTALSVRYDRPAVPRFDHQQHLAAV